MARFSLIPREEQFFDEFVGLAEQIRTGARMLKQMLASDPPDMAKAEAIKDIEHVCDGTTRGIIDRLNRTFVTPLDREDIHALASSLDDVMDAIDAAAAVVRLYKITHVRPGARRLADIIMRVDGPHHARRWRRSRSAPACWSSLRGSISSSTKPTACHQDAIVELFDQETRPDRGHQVEGDLRLPRGGHRPVRGRRQPARRRRRQARAERMDHTLLAVLALIAVALDLRLHQRLSRRGQLDRHDRVHARADAGPGRRSGRRSSISSRRSASARRSRKTVGAGMVDLTSSPSR